MQKTSAQATRCIVISDLHLGGTPPCMMSHPERLAAFIDALPTKLGRDEQLELVIAGDFIDYLAIPAQASWTPDPIEARTKLRLATSTDSPFAPIFAALARHVASRHRLTILIGNHDVELALPLVQDELLNIVGASRHQVLFVDDGRAYRIGRALIEHGNRYDGANINDWTNLRAIVSALSRCEAPRNKLEVSAGSKIVEKVVNVIKPNYPFIDLLQPQGEVVALLLVAFEPGLMFHWRKIARMLQGERKQQSNRDGLQPGKTRNVSYRPLAKPDEELREVFGELYDQLHSPTTEVGFSDLISSAWAGANNSLSQILARGEAVPPERLRQIRLAMRRMLLDDRSAEVDGPTAQYGMAAERLVAESCGEIETVVMGHTHLARHIGDSSRAWYINTGTWADVVRVPPSALEDDHALQSFLSDLVSDKLRASPCTYGDLRIEPEGKVSQARLEYAAP